MTIDSVQVGAPKSVIWNGKSVETAIFKSPVEGPVNALGDNLEGDRQADLRVHGGRDKAVYAYAKEHYAWWQQLRPTTDFTPGQFGENLTIAGGLLEDQVFIGDLYQAGTVHLRVVQPRLPCFKLGIRFGDEAVLRQFVESNRPGVYFRIEQEGTLQKGDAVSLLERTQTTLSVLDVAQMYLGMQQDRELLSFAVEEPFLAESMKSRFRQVVERSE